MNTASIAPEVAQFAEAVRARLADLTSDEREELAGGLEADLTDLVEERGVEALGDPVVYAEELRTAAGLSPAMGQVRIKKAAGETVAGWLDAAHDRWDRAVTGLPGSPWEFVVSLQPAWWVLRAYVAVQSIDLLMVGSWQMGWVPTLDGLGVPLLLLAVALSVQIGRSKLWPGSPGVVARVVLLGLNLFAVCMVFPVFGSLPNATWAQIDSGYTDTAYSTGITSNGSDVSNIYPYDADGQPLTGIQLFDQYGAPLKVDEYAAPWTYPWSNVNGEVWNTFPMPQGAGDEGGERQSSPWTSDTPPTFALPPHDRVPSVTIPDAAYGESQVQETTPEMTPEKTPEKKKSQKSGR
ncbi:hypothetical protein [Nocardioides sp. InS609-2]|uniref:hypothetical protein n=1 Tax=Nocardioides sp. InS609-2 TaxID=2760705 RepID=UPI0020BF8078|nr:hypothetical protein [Nocardioides sp. InS609-2]